MRKNSEWLNRCDSTGGLKNKSTCLHGVQHGHRSSQHRAEHLLVQPFGHGEQRVHQRETPEEPQGQDAVRMSHEDVDDVVSAGRRDDDRQVDGGRRGVGVLLADVVGR